MKDNHIGSNKRPKLKQH